MVKGAVLFRRVLNNALASAKIVHTGIYIGNDMVIDFITEGGVLNSSGKMRKITLKKFANGHEVFEAIRPVNHVHGKWIARHAEWHFNNPNHFFEKYNMILNDCQTFTKMVFSEPFTHQGELMRPDSPPSNFLMFKNFLTQRPVIVRKKSKVKK